MKPKVQNKKRIAVLTAGGDAPGLNGIIESSCRSLLMAGYEIIGVCDGFEGIFEGRTKPINFETLRGLHSQAGTYLGSSNRATVSKREKEFVEKYRALNVRGLLVAGGDGTFNSLSLVAKDIPLIGVPKTIDNDLSGTEVTFGFDTACAVVSDSVDALRATADAHKRVIIVETMGRTSGWIALGGGLAGYADAILIPERPYNKTKFLEFLKHQQNRGARGVLVVVSEGARAKGEKAKVAFKVKESAEADRLGGVGQSLARWIEKEIGWESRHVVLGHLQRARHPTTTDRFLTLAMGVEVARLVQKDKWGYAAVYREGRVTTAPLEDLMKAARLVDPNHRWVKLAQSLQIFI